jgi:pimeloyl-ACP methyl ester carboxylesterase
VLTERQWDSGSVVLNYAESDHTRPPLVMLHGITKWWQDFLPVTPRLSDRWHLYALDLRGHGGSGRVKECYDMDSYAGDCIRFLKQQVKEPAFLLGHSLGGMIAIQIAAREPGLVRALVLEDPPIYAFNKRNRGDDPQFVLWRDLAASGLHQNQLVDQLRDYRPEKDEPSLRLKARSLSLMDPDVLNMYFDGRATKNYDIEKLLPAIQCPALLLRADPKMGGRIEDDEETAAMAALKNAASSASQA